MLNRVLAARAMVKSAVSPALTTTFGASLHILKADELTAWTLPGDNAGIIRMVTNATRSIEFLSRLAVT